MLDKKEQEKLKKILESCHINFLIGSGVSTVYFQTLNMVENLLTELNRKQSIISPDSFISSHFTVLPEQSFENRFYDLMEHIQSSKQKNVKENEQLASLRDWLLSMLMNGQVRLGEVEEELGMVAEENVGYKKEEI